MLRPATTVLNSFFAVALLAASSAAGGQEATTQSLSPQEDRAPKDHLVDFQLHIQPLFRKHCISCHGSEKQESGLRLDQAASAMLGGDQGVVIVPGNSEKSRLIQFVTSTNPDTVMPPEGTRLSAEEVKILRAWIDQGATWPATPESEPKAHTHWAYQPIQNPEPPAIVTPAGIKNPIDAFIIADLQQKGLTPSPEASRFTLIRRLSLDLTGLLPSVEEVDAFVQSQDPDAFEKLVDRLLASPHFGERWGRHWLDMARYADSDGYEKDNPRPDAWRWRDWVIDAINSDMPFDQFTVEQLAGDLLPEATPMQRLATAFHRQTLTNTEGGTDQEQFRVEACFDRTETTGTVWLGLTVGCARCHTHKYDAITQREYYQLYSVFNNGDESTAVVPSSEEAVQSYAIAKAAYDSKTEDITKKIGEQQQQQSAAFVEWQEQTQAQLAVASTMPLQDHVLLSPQVTCDSDVTFEVRKDGSVLASGANPDRATYVLTSATDLQEFTGLRLEVLPDPSLPSNGPGRVSHGNFVLSEITMEIAANADFSDAVKVEFSDARADFEQSDQQWPAKHVIDGQDATGWAIAPQFGKPHWLILRLKGPVSLSSRPHVRLHISHQYGSQHVIGCFRVSLQTGIELDPSLSPKLAEALKVTADQRTAEQQQQLLEHYSRQVSPTRELLAELDALKKLEPPKPEVTARVIVQRTKEPRVTFVLKRGEFLDPIRDLEVQPAAFSTLPPLTSRTDSGTADRLDLARWLVSPENPLTPRVTVNHFWRMLFGHGLVRTANDFGIRGDRPTHPELLDFLAADFMTGAGSGRPWSRKAIIKRIVMSATYRQASVRRSDLEEADPQNLSLARQNRLRVEGEIVRDISLDASGLLSRKIGGPSAYPPLPPGIAELSYAGNFKWSDSTGEDRYRRGMYTFFKRTSPHPNLITFDCPDANITCIERQISNTPLQALTSLNNETFSETARAFARRILMMPMPEFTPSAKATGTSELTASMMDSARLQQAFRTGLARHGNAAELQELQSLLDDSRSWYESHPDQAVQLIATDRVDGVSASDNAAWIAVARVILNLDEFITRE